MEKPWRAGAALTALLVVLAGCSTDEEENSPDPDQITVLLDEADEEITERVGDAGAFDEHPHQPEGVEINVAHPEFEGAEEFSQGLADRVDAEVQDFRGASRDPVSLDIDWEITGAGEGVLGVRLVRTEEDMHGLRQGYATYWYDESTGHTASSTELLADQESLEELNELVRTELADEEEVDVEGLYPVLRTYDSMGFNTEGDFVVEFDDGHLSPVEEGHPPSAEPGRITAVLDHGAVEPLLSELGAQAREASLVDEPVLVMQEPDEPPEEEEEEANRVPGVIEAENPDVDCFDGVTRCIALTFDDGPDEATPELLDLFEEEGVQATFFLNGGPTLTRPWVLRRAYSEGHEIANHGDLHEEMPEEFADDEFPEQVAAVSAMVRRQTGHSVELFRPPYGATSPELLEQIEQQNMAEVLWTLDSEDWEGLDSDEIVERVALNAEPSDIVLLHDTQPETVAAVPELVERLDALDFEMVTVSQALGGLEPGDTYPPEGLG